MNDTAAYDPEDFRKALQHVICKIIFEEDRAHGTRTTPSAISALTELTFQYATKSLIPDLYAFSTHANRKSTIVPDDVAMVLRKLPSDQLEEFKMNFCGGNKDGKIDNKKKSSSTTTAGRRGKSNDKGMELSSSSSSSSDDENDEGGNKKSKNDRKQQVVSNIRTKNHGRKSSTTYRTCISGTPGVRRRNSNDNNGVSSIQKDKESIMNIFQLSEIRNNSDSSTEDEDITKSSATPKLSLKSFHNNLQEQSKKRFKSTTNNRHDPLLVDTAGSTTDDEDVNTSVIEVATRKPTNSTSTNNGNDHIIALDDNDDMENDFNSHHPDNRHRKKTGTPKQSQVAEALANLSDDSGMDENNNVNGDNNQIVMKPRHRPVIESSDDEK